MEREKWSLKDLHRLIVTSATYRQSSRNRPELAERDPHNTLLARQARLRLEAEIVRDNCPGRQRLANAATSAARASSRRSPRASAS